MRILLLAGIPAAALFAQMPTPPGIQDLLKLPEIHRVQATPAIAWLVLPGIIPAALTPAHVCAIPLTNLMRKDPRDSITIPVVPQSGPTRSMPEVKLPAPPCDDKRP